MPALPDALPLDPVSGAAPSTAVVQPTDLGLQQAGANFEGVALMDRTTKRLQIRAQAMADKQAVAPNIAQLQGANATDLDTAIAGGKAGTDGFVTDQYNNAAERAQRAASLDGLTPGQASEVQAAGMAHAAQIAVAAGDAHARALAAPIADIAKAQQTNDVGVGVGAYQASFLPAYQAAQNAYLPGGDVATFVNQVGAAHDAAAAAGLAAAPDGARPALQAQFAAGRVQAVSDAQSWVVKQGQTNVLSGADQVLNGFASGVAENPAGYPDAVGKLKTYAAGLPAGLGAAVLSDGQARLATARVSALIDNGHPDQALTELQGGQYNDILSAKEVEGLLAKAQEKNDNSGPAAFAKAQAAQAMAARADAAMQSVAAGRGLPADAPSVGEAMAALGPARAAQYSTNLTQAYRDAATAGAVHTQSQTQLFTTLHTPAPDASDPNYTAKLASWQATQDAATAEVKARAKPGQWAFTATTPAGGGATVGSNVSGAWSAFAANPSDPAAGAHFAAQSLGSQQGVGIDKSKYQLAPDSVVQGLAATVINAPPEGRLAAMQNLGKLLNGLPASLKLGDGSYVSPRALLAQQLQAAHLSPIEFSAIADFGNNPAALGRVVAAINDPTLKASMKGPQAATLALNVKAALTPLLNSAAAQPGQQALAQARIDRTTLVAKAYVAQGMDPVSAANAAAKDLTGQYQFQDGWRIPTSAIPAPGTTVPGGTIKAGPLVGEPVPGVSTDGVGMVRAGAAMLLNQLTGQNGANIFPDASRGGSLQTQRQSMAGVARQNGKWQTLPDDSGLTLVVPNGTAGAYAQVRDAFGRPVTATWGQLNDQAQGHQSGNPFAAPPPSAVKLPDGTRLPAVSTQAAFNALSYAVTNRESRGRDGLVSDQGALGRMQVLPSVVQQYAPRLGLPVDLNRARDDGVYNSRIGNAYLADLANHYGAGNGAGLMLAAAAYHDGQGNVDGYNKSGVYHPGLLQTYGDPRSGQVNPEAWLNAIAARAPKTAAYIREVLPMAALKLQGKI